MYATYAGDGEITLHYEDSTVEMLQPPYEFIMNATGHPARIDIITPEETFTDIEVRFERLNYIMEPVEYDLGGDEEPASEPESPPVTRPRIQRRRLARRLPPLPEPLKSFFERALRAARAGRPKPTNGSADYAMLNRVYRNFPEWAALITAANRNWFIQIRR
jgi:hypothetical protein